MSASVREKTPSGEIEVGEIEGDGLRLWRATQAVRHAELHLSAQASNLAAMESRATSILGWSVAGTFVLGAGAVSETYRAAASIGAACLFLAGFVIVIGIFWPYKWGVSGYQPKYLLDEKFQTELEYLEYFAGGYQATIIENEKRLIGFSKYLKASWFLFLASPLAAFVALFIF